MGWAKALVDNSVNFYFINKAEEGNWKLIDYNLFCFALFPPFADQCPPSDIIILEDDDDGIMQQQEQQPQGGLPADNTLDLLEDVCK